MLTVYDAAGHLVPQRSKSESDRYVLGAYQKGVIARLGDPEDASTYLTLDAGAYTIRVTDTADATGVVLLEAYEDPDLGGLPRYGSLRSGAREPRLLNLSTRGLVGTNENTLIGGFIVTGDTPREVLIRAAGPSLAAFGLGNPATAPSLTLFRGDGSVIAANGGWGTATRVLDRTITAADIREANTITGAFPFSEGSHDAALLVTLPPGPYTAHVGDPSGQPKIALLEIFEVKR